jgi:hypothetical protein
MCGILAENLSGHTPLRRAVQLCLASLNVQLKGAARGAVKLNSVAELIQKHQEALHATYVYIGLDVHKRMISYCVKDSNGRIHSEGSLPLVLIWIAG